MTRKKYQRGSVQLKERANGPDVWTFRYMEGSQRRSTILGDKKKFPTKALAEKEADKLRAEVADLSRSLNIAEAIRKYKLEDMPQRESTKRSYISNLEHIRKRWGKMAAAAMARDIMEVEKWLNGLKRQDGQPMSKKTLHNLKAQLHVLFESIIRWGGLELQRNPMDLLRIKVKAPTRKMRKVQVIVSVEQFEAILLIVAPHVAMMVQIAMCTGMRISEILGLKWEDIDLAAGILVVERSSVGKHQDDTKTEASNDDVPLHDNLVAALKAWKQAEPVIEDWVFGSPVTSRPYHRDSLQADHLRPAGRDKTVRIPNLGWHSFRHTYRAMMRDLGLPLEVQQRLMRHASMDMTLKYGGRQMKALKGHSDTIVEILTKNKERKTA